MKKPTILAIITAAFAVWGCAGPQEPKPVVIDWSCWDADGKEIDGWVALNENGYAEITLPARETPRTETPICVAVPQEPISGPLILTITKQKVWVEIR